MTMRLYTIGHSTRTLDELVDALRSLGVRHLIDIRAVPRPKTGFTLLHVGRLAPTKDDATLLRAFALTRTHYPDLQLWMVGDGPLESSLRDLSKELGLSDCVTCFGEQADVSPFLLARRALTARHSVSTRRLDSEWRAFSHSNHASPASSQARKRAFVKSEWGLPSRDITVFALALGATWKS